jgi:two-component system alkaline phosphatase synthesis response regulator PhoP
MTGKKTVLLVEDDDSVRQLVRLSLERHDFEVVEASGGAEGLDLVDRHRPDAVVLDLMMPLGAGDRLLTELRAGPKTERIPVVVVSGKPDVGDEVIGLVGRENFLVKPFDPEALIERVKAVVG